MELNVKKWGHGTVKGTKKSYWNYKMSTDLITKAQEENDLGIIFQNDLSPENTVKITRETYEVSKRIKMAFHFMDEDIMWKLIVPVIYWHNCIFQTGICSSGVVSTQKRIP